MKKEDQEQSNAEQTSAHANSRNFKRESPSPGWSRRRNLRNLLGNFAALADFLGGGQGDAAMGAKIFLFIRLGKGVRTGCAVLLAHPDRGVAGRTLGHKTPPDRFATCR